MQLRLPFMTDDDATEDRPHAYAVRLWHTSGGEAQPLYAALKYHRLGISGGAHGLAFMDRPRGAKTFKSRKTAARFIDQQRLTGKRHQVIRVPLPAKRTRP